MSSLYYRSPLAPDERPDIYIEADEQGLTGLWFVDQVDSRKESGTDGDATKETDAQKDAMLRRLSSPQALEKPEKVADTVLKMAVSWLDLYFSGKVPDFIPPLHPSGSKFQLLVWSYLLDIPYGKTATYGDLAKRAARDLGKKAMSAQAIGGAMGRNPISLIVPCHRVVGAGGKLTGYGGGLWRKEELLEMESQHR